jgi:predicted dehydrogenase
MPSQDEKSGRIRYAVIGAGDIAQTAVLPAFEHAPHAQLTALVSGDPKKRDELGCRYRIPKVYSYESYDECLRSGEIDSVYIALPDSMHCEYTVRAAEAGIHVLCEKPMAETEADCERMMRAARENKVKLMIAYRLHFDEANLDAIAIAQSGKLGELRIFDSVNTQNVAPGNVRLKRATGRGPLYDAGIYCINAARYLFRDEPIEASCAHSKKKGAERFNEVPEMSSATLRFPGDRIATFTCSYGASKVSSYRLIGTKGDLRMDPAYAYDRELKRYVTIDDETEERSYPVRDQFAPELEYFADCILADLILNDSDPEPSGMEGLADIRVIEALQRSASEGRPIGIPPFQRQRRPGPEQARESPPSKKPDLIKAESPTGDK